VALALYLAISAQVIKESKHHDFLNMYTAAHFSRTGMLDNLYDATALRDFQETIAPENNFVVPFARPQFYAVLLTPLSLMPYDTAFGAWLVFQSALLIACWVWLAKRFGPDGLIAASFFYPAAIGVAHGQDSSLVLALLVASYAASERRDERKAGVLAGCLLFKFHLVLFVPVAMVFQKRWRMLSGFLAAGVVVVAVQFLAAGVGGTAGYLRFLAAGTMERLNVGEANMVNLKSLLLNLGVDSVAARGTLSMAVGALILAGFTNRQWTTALTSASLGAAVLLPHVYQYDLAWTLPLFLAIAFQVQDRLLRISVMPLLTPFPYLLTLAGRPWAGTASVILVVVLAANARWAWRSRELFRVQPGEGACEADAKAQLLR
jgi:hypothetical protein